MIEQKTVTTDWSLVSSSTTVSFQVTNLQTSGAKVIFAAAASAPAAGTAIGFHYCVGQSEINEPLTAFGAGPNLYARTTAGVAAVTVA